MSLLSFAKNILSSLPKIWEGKKASTAHLPQPDNNFSANVLIRQDEQHSSDDYTNLKAIFRDHGRLNAIAETLGRDFLTAMPEGAWKSRLGQLAYLSTRNHMDLGASGVAKLIDKAKNHRENNTDEWDEWDSANLREMEEKYLSTCHVPVELIDLRTRLSYEGRRVHRDTLATGDWEVGKAFLEKTVDMNCRIAEAHCKATGQDNLYESMMQNYMPGMQFDNVDLWFKSLKEDLTEILPKIVAKQEKNPKPQNLKDFYPPKAQMWLNRAVLGSMGFDYRRGGLFETGHNPVEGGTPDDTRLVIKNVDRDNFMGSLKSTIHEGGHGLYTQGLPRRTWRYQPVGQDLGAAVQESQALLMDMIIGRSRSFFDFLSPRLEGLFHGLQNPVLSSDNLYRTRNHVEPTVLRRFADEVTYFFHVYLRFQLEQQIVDGSLKLRDLPEAWDNGLEELLGIRPKGLKDGCMQDVHWYVGKVGYFPSYTLGNMMACQIWSSLQKDVHGTDEDIRNGDFTRVTKWLGDNIWSKGRLLTTQDLMLEVTGKTLGTKCYVQHLKRRYLSGE